ncbi:MAG: 3-hydroxyacyl-CoA dehydrogenase NAD-binding domain-containing protein, partial [Alcaligenes sp.]
MSSTTSTPVVTNHPFAAEGQLHKLPFATQARSVSRAAVIGAGTMGGGIAMCFANAGIPVVLLEKDAERLSQGLARIEENYANSARRGRLSAGDVAQRLACIQGSTRFEDLADVDLVI